MDSSHEPLRISANTRISTLIRANQGVIEAIASINKHFHKLRNPLLRKVLASRITIADAARIGGTEVGVIFDKLKPLGFVSEKPGVAAKIPAATPVPQLPPVGIMLDVRQALEEGHDPFKEIMEAAAHVSENHSLLVINTFEPIPLLAILGKKGFGHYTTQLEANLVHTYFYRSGQAEGANDTMARNPAVSFESLQQQYHNGLLELDVRNLEMPLPMVAILEALPNLNPPQALLVYHRRVPQYLLPQLSERGFAYAIAQPGPDEVRLLIYKIPGHGPDRD
jgi:uncharacterized protein (DUF2249 family)